MPNPLQPTQCLNFCLFVNVDWFVLSHFTDYLKLVIESGVEVTVMTLNTGRCEEIRKLGARVIEVDLDRGYSNIFSECRAFFRIYKTIKELSPDVLELVTIKAVLLGGLASRMLPINKTVFYMSGLGAIFTHQTTLGKIKANLVALVYKLIMRSRGSAVVVENEDDREHFVSAVGLAPDRTYLIPGVGVDLIQYSPSPKVSSCAVRVAVASRLLYDKGILEFAEAANICRKSNREVEFLIVGQPDPTNPASLSPDDLARLNADDSVQVLGHCNEMAGFLKTLDVFVLPSYREGFPRAIMEAAATGLPVVATDVIGCRSAVIDGKTGLLVPTKNPQALADCICKLIDSPELRYQLGSEARRMAVSTFDVHDLSLRHMNVWT